MTEETTQEALDERLDRIEKRMNDLEQRIAALEQVQVSRQEFDAFKARVEMLEQAQRYLKRGMAEFIVRI